MTAGAARSARGIDPEARKVAEALARQQGLSLTDWLARFMAEEAPEDATSQDFFNSTAPSAYVETPRSMTAGPSRYEAPEHPADEVSRVVQALDRLSARIEAAEQRSAHAINGVDSTVRQVIQRLDATERDQISVAARFEGAVQDVQQEQSRVAERVRRIEQEAHGPRSAEALRSLEAALGKVASHLYEGEGRTRAELAEVRARVDRFESEPSDVVEAVVSRLGARLEEAEKNTSGALRELQSSFAALDGRLKSVESGSDAAVEARLEHLAASLSSRVDAARAEMAEKMRATADTRFDRMERALSEMTEHVRTAEQRSAQAIERMGREVVDLADTLSRRVQTVEHRNAEAIEQVGGEVARIAQAVESKLGRADTVQAQALEKLGLEIARITERLSERIANSERRAAQAIDDVGEQVARVTERISQRHERSTTELAERIERSEERTAKLLEEAREKLEKLTEQRKAAEAARAEYDADEGLFADDPFSDFKPAPAAATAYPSATPISGAFPPRPFRQALTTSYSAPTAYAAEETVAALRPRIEPEFSPEDFEAASGFTVGNLALDTREAELFAEDETEALEEIAPDSSAEVAAEWVEIPMAESESDVSAGAATAGTDTDAATEGAMGGAALAPAPEAVEERPPEAVLEPAAPAAVDVPLPAIETFRLPEDAADDPFDKPLSTREAVERARSAARGAAGGGAAPDRRRPSADPADSAALFAPGFGRSKRRTRVSPAIAGLSIGMAAAVGGAFYGFYLLQQAPAPLPPRVQNALAMARDKIEEIRTPEADTTPKPKGQPQFAVALAPKPISELAPAAGASAKPAEDLGHSYSVAAAQVEAKDPRGLVEIRRLANLGFTPAQFFLAKQYEGGTGGVRKDMAEARRWTERAAEGGERKAMHNLGLYYFEGTGGPKNTTTAAQWFRRAADLGLVDSQYNLGRLYEGGFGVAANPAEAYKWYLIAARSGDEDSRTSANRVKAALTADARTAAERSAHAFRSGGSTAVAAAPAAPVSDLATAQKALSTLGYYQGPTDGASSPALRLALQAYQRENGLPATGAPDPATIGKLAAYIR